MNFSFDDRLHQWLGRRHGLQSSKWSCDKNGKIRTQLLVWGSKVEIWELQAGSMLRIWYQDVMFKFCELLWNALGYLYNYKIKWLHSTYCQNWKKYISSFSEIIVSRILNIALYLFSLFLSFNFKKENCINNKTNTILGACGSVNVKKINRRC